MLDFKELPSDGSAFELLVREIAFTEGFATYWSGIGPDSGKDLLCRQKIQTILGEFEKSWVIQCKHFAHSGRSVGTGDITAVSDVCRHHSVTGYILATSTYPSSALVQRFEGLAQGRDNSLNVSVWDGVFIERILKTPQNWSIAQRFFPVSANQAGWSVNATTSPNSWVVNFRGHHVQLTNRIGSNYKYHFKSMAGRIDDLSDIDLPNGHFFRLRAVWYDDKNGGYRYYIDYMVLQGTAPRYSKENIAKALGDGWALDDGQVYYFDIAIRKYNVASDHYDQDHYDYYTPYMGSFLVGDRRFVRDSIWHFSDEDVVGRDKRPVSARRDRPFKQFCTLFEGREGFRLVRAAAATPEALRLFSDEIEIRSTVEKQNVSFSNAMMTELVFDVDDEEIFYDFLTNMPQDFDVSISVFKKRLYLPSDEGRRSKMITGEDLHFVQIEANEYAFSTIDDIRAAFNKYYLDAIGNVIGKDNKKVLRPSSI